MMEAAGWDLDAAANSIESNVIYAKRAHKERRCTFKGEFLSSISCYKGNGSFRHAMSEPNYVSGNLCTSRFACSFDPNFKVFQVMRGNEFSEDYMGSAVKNLILDGSDPKPRAGLMVMPGFWIGGSGVQSRVHLSGPIEYNLGLVQVKCTLDQVNEVLACDSLFIYSHLPHPNALKLVFDIFPLPPSTPQPSTIMARTSLFILLLLLSIVCLSGAMKPARSSRRSRARAYVEKECNKTRYPSLCIQYLSVSANSTIQTPQQLAQAALSVSLYKALQTRTFMMKVAKELKAMKSKDYQAVKDCLDQICDSVDQLSESVRELHRLERLDVAGGDDVFWHISNVETWVGSAMTDASTCLDEFSGRDMNKLRALIKAKVLNVAQTASNALSMFHRYAAKYKP
ncbi:hypothetical protein SADUNF_Sadunf14G0042700 [Salix dunnii]|uniref:Pectinesterase inhibitor domain-containing protein n=1 Tax=Salix dunnii TaxID=1413687 RepID=A0A835JG62_9ROSI|nr:hypothetical protein SADUNF_Sadunf14G0042700 [Salix dunnii]